MDIIVGKIISVLQTSFLAVLVGEPLLLNIFVFFFLGFTEGPVVTATLLETSQEEGKSPLIRHKLEFSGLLDGEYFTLMCRNSSVLGYSDFLLQCSSDRTLQHSLPQDNPVEYTFFSRMVELKRNHWLAIMSVDDKFETLSVMTTLFVEPSKWQQMVSCVNFSLI